MFIYRILFPEGESYIGFTNNISKRKNSHLSKARNNKNNKVYKAIRKCGEENLE